MRKPSILIFTILIFVTAVSCKSEHTLFCDGKSDYSIVLSENATESEIFAAQEIQKSILEISGAKLPVVKTPEGQRGRRIILDSRHNDFKDESFTYCNKGGDIVIRGGGQRGTMYGAFSFLENELGVRWYTSKVTLNPARDCWSFTKLNHHEEPGMAIRNVFFYDAFDPDWSAHNKSNGRMGGEVKVHGGVEQFWGCHTFGKYVPFDKYHAEHSEYFNILDGQRVDGTRPYTVQLCLTNPEVLQLCIDGVKETMREHPEATIVDLSQNDSYGDFLECCECEECRKIAEQYGGQSGLMLWFVNQVADAVKEEFPDRYVGTFAYRFTRKPPVGIAPRENVVVRLCSIECCFLHGFAECSEEKTKEFHEDLMAWSQIAPHLYIWDYVVTFTQYSIPFPNFGALQSNIRSFRDNNVFGVMEQGAYQSYGGEKSGLRAYLLAKLLWNPDCDVDAVIDDFCLGFYGPDAGPLVRDYYALEQSLVSADSHCGIYPDVNNPILTPEFIASSEELFAKALEAVKDNTELYNRVELAYFPILVLKYARAREAGKEDGTYDRILKIVKRENITYLSEGGSSEVWLQ